MHVTGSMYSHTKPMNCHWREYRCNLHQYVLNRTPEFFKLSEFMIDEFHANSHKECSINYNSSQFQTRARNFSLCEQKNRSLAALSTPFARMDQFSFLELCRFKLAAINKYQEERNSASHRVFWRPPLAFVRAVNEFNENEEDSDEDSDEEADEESLNATERASGSRAT